MHEDFGYFGDESFLEPFDLDRQMMDWNIHNDHADGLESELEWERRFEEAEFARGFDEAHARSEENDWYEENQIYRDPEEWEG